MRGPPLALLVLLFVSATGLTEAADLSPSDFAYGMSIETPAPAAAYRLTVPLEVYRRIAHEDLRDLRVFNAKGEVVPYEFQRPQPIEVARSHGSSLPLFPLRGDARVSLDGLRVTIRSKGAAMDLQTGAPSPEPQAITSYVLDGRDLKPPLSGLQLHWQDGAPEFSASIRLESSDDLGSWRVVNADAPVMNLHTSGSELIQSRLEFPSTKAKFWRLTWVGKAAPVELTSVTADSTPDQPAVPQSTVTLPGIPVHDSTDERAFDLGAKLPVTQISIELPEANSAVKIELLSRAHSTDTWRPIAQGEFYRVHTGASDQRNVPIHIPTNFDRFWLARQVQPTGAIGDVKLAATWSDVDLVFLARGEGPFLLAYGSGSASASSMVLGSLLGGIAILPAKVGDSRPLGGAARLQPAPRTVPWRMTVLWAALGCGVLLLAWMAYRLSREVGTRTTDGQ